MSLELVYVKESAVTADLNKYPCTWLAESLPAGQL